MNNQDFHDLQYDINNTMIDLNLLQDEYQKLTGVKFIPGQQIKNPSYCDTCRFLTNDSDGLFCNCPDSEFFEIPNPLRGCAEHDEEDGASSFV